MTLTLDLLSGALLTVAELIVGFALASLAFRVLAPILARAIKGGGE